MPVANPSFETEGAHKGLPASWTVVDAEARTASLEIPSHYATAPAGGGLTKPHEDFAEDWALPASSGNNAGSRFSFVSADLDTALIQLIAHDGFESGWQGNAVGFLNSFDALAQELGLTDDLETAWDTGPGYRFALEWLSAIAEPAAGYPLVNGLGDQFRVVLTGTGPVDVTVDLVPSDGATTTASDLAGRINAALPANRVTASAVAGASKRYLRLAVATGAPAGSILTLETPADAARDARPALFSSTELAFLRVSKLADAIVVGLDETFESGWRSNESYKSSFLAADLDQGSLSHAQHSVGIGDATSGPNVTYVAKNAGTSGNAILVAHVLHATADAPTSVTETVNSIVVSLRRNAANVVLATNAEVAGAVNLHATASLIVNATAVGTATAIATVQASSVLLTGGGLNDDFERGWFGVLS